MFRYVCSACEMGLCPSCIRRGRGAGLLRAVMDEHRQRECRCFHRYRVTGRVREFGHWRVLETCRRCGRVRMPPRTEPVSVAEATPEELRAESAKSRAIRWLGV